VSTVSRAVALFFAAVIFGLLLAWIKGQGAAGYGSFDQVRSAIGNLSAPWLALPFLAGTIMGRVWPGALAGLMVSLTALVAFYILTAVVVPFDGLGVLASTTRWISVNRAYLEGGLLTGPVLGGLGGGWREHWKTGRRTLLIGGILAGEPLILLGLGWFTDGVSESSSHLPMLLRILPGWGLTTDRPTPQLATYAAECCLGLLLIIGSVLASARRARG
jgi:hypothetical protein